MDGSEYIQLKYVIASLLYSGIGIAIFIVSLVVLDLVTPRVSVWREICEKQNMALAVLLGSMAIGTALIIASAIHG
jgi:putative membrane protein